MLPEVEEWSPDRAARPVTPKNTEKRQQQWHDSNYIFHPPSSTLSRSVYEVHWISLKALPLHIEVGGSNVGAHKVSVLHYSNHKLAMIRSWRLCSLVCISQFFSGMSRYSLTSRIRVPVRTWVVVPTSSLSMELPLYLVPDSLSLGKAARTRSSSFTAVFCLRLRKHEAYVGLPGLLVSSNPTSCKAVVCVLNVVCRQCSP